MAIYLQLTLCYKKRRGEPWNNINLKQMGPLIHRWIIVRILFETHSWVRCCRWLSTDVIAVYLILFIAEHSLSISLTGHTSHILINVEFSIYFIHGEPFLQCHHLLMGCGSRYVKVTFVSRSLSPVYLCLLLSYSAF